MSFQVYEESTDQGLEVELYRFSNAGGAHEWLYTDSEIPVVRPEGTYLIGPIDRGEISSSGNLDKSKLDVTVAGNHPVAILFAVNPPTFGIDLVIRSGHFDDPDAEFVQIWDGRVLSCEWSDDAKVAVLTCEPLTASMRRIGLRRMYQKSCPHALYGDRCRAVKSLHTFECTVVSITGRVLGVVPPPEQSAAAIQEVVETVVAEVDMVFRGGGFFSGALITALFLAATQVAVSLPAAAMGDLKTFVSGQVDWTAPDGFRWVRTVEDFDRVSDSLALVTCSGVVPGLQVGDVVQLVRGCPHTLDVCFYVFANILNYGGMPWIPLKTPLGIHNPY